MTSMFGHNVRSDLLLLYFAETLVVFLTVYGFLAVGLGRAAPVDQVSGGLIAGTLALCFGLVFGASGLYQPEALSGPRRFLAGILVAGLLLMLVTSISLQLFAPVPEGSSSWARLAGVLLGCIAGVAATRLAFAAASRSGLFRRRLLVIGEHNLAIGAEVDGGLGAFEIAFLPSGSAGQADGLRPERLRADHTWAVVADDPAALTLDQRRACQRARVRILSGDEFHECRLNRVASDRLPRDWLASARGSQESVVEAALRRCFDIAVGLLLLILTLPLFIATAILVRLDSPGPVLYRQERIGLKGRVFTLYKFRSMVVNAESGGAPRWATPQDPRITRLGRFIRLTRIDELPQIFNVLRGEMSIVGPRPERPGFVEQLGRAIPHYHDRACVKPGITGWAQVNYPYGASVEDARMKLAYDLYYVRRRSLFLDLLILVATVRVVLFQEGAR